MTGNERSAGRSAFVVRRLERADAAALRALRLEALEAHPDAFGASVEDERERPVTWFADMLESSFVLGGWPDAATLAGMAGVYQQAERKARHKAVLWGMYVRPGARGSGIARALIEGCIDYARERAEEIMLSVGAHNPAAIARYRSLGFVECGSEQRAIKTGGRYYDEILMAIRFGDADDRRQKERVNPTCRSSSKANGRNEMSKITERSSNEPDKEPAPVLPADPQPRGGDQGRPMTADEELDEALDETFPASDPIAPSRIDGPGN